MYGLCTHVQAHMYFHAHMAHTSMYTIHINKLFERQRRMEEHIKNQPRASICAPMGVSASHNAYVHGHKHAHTREHTYTQNREETKKVVLINFIPVTSNMCLYHYRRNKNLTSNN